METVTRKLRVPEEHAGQRLDRVAASLMPEFSRSRLKQWIDKGWLTVGGAQLAPKCLLRGGETLELSARLEPEVPVDAEPIPLNVVASARAYYVIDKPAGLVVHPGAGNRRGTLQNALLNVDPGLANVPRAGLVHRLDKQTSGLLVVARTLTAQHHLVAQIESRRVARTYQAVCQGRFTGGGTVDAPIGRHRTERKKMAVSERGRPSRTHYRVLERFRAQSLIELSLETGRTHQIRVHMAHLRRPVVGDPVYGGRPRFPKNSTEALRESLQNFGRQALHATQLAFDDPDTGVRASFDSPVADDIAELLDALRADAAGHQ